MFYDPVIEHRANKDPRHVWKRRKSVPATQPRGTLPRMFRGASGAPADRNERAGESRGGRRDRGTRPRVIYIAGVVQTRARGICARMCTCTTSTYTYTSGRSNMRPDARLPNREAGNSLRVETHVGLRDSSHVNVVKDFWQDIL